MDVLARIPELRAPRTADVARHVAGEEATERGATALGRVERGPGSFVPRAAGAGRWPRIPTGSITVLALVAAAIWTLVAWRERQDARAARAAVQLARQHETATTVERAR